MRKFQTILAAFLIFGLMTGTVFAGDGGDEGELSNGAIVNISGQLDPAEINIRLDSANIILDMDSGVTEATDSITITSESIIPVKIEVTEFRLKDGEDRWSPELVDDLDGITLAEAQNKAILSLSSDGDFGRIGTNAFTVFADTSAVDLGALAEITDDITESSVELEGKLETDKRRILGKGFEGDLTLTFSADVD